MVKLWCLGNTMEEHTGSPPGVGTGQWEGWDLEPGTRKCESYTESCL